MKKLDTSKLNRNLLSERVYEELEENILNGSLAPGDALPEIPLAEEFGVSRTPVREAIRNLELEGLVRSIPNRGTLVVGISAKDIDDIYAIRGYVEGLAARWAAEHVTAEQLGQMQNVVALQEFYAGRGDFVQVWQLDTRFHQLLYQASGSHVLRQTLSNLHRYIQRVRELSIKKPGRAGPSVREHRSVLEAIEKRNGKEAESRMASHIHNAHANIQSGV